MMRKISRKSWLGRLTRAGAVFGTVGLCSLSTAWGQDRGAYDSEDQKPGARYFQSALQEQPPASAKIPSEGEPGAPESPATGTAEALPGMAAETPAAAPEEGPWSLTSVFNNQRRGTNWLSDNGWKLGGSTVQSYTINFDHPADHYNGPVTWTDRSDEYQLNQQWLYLERATDTTTKDWDIGGRVDVLYGTSARLTTEAGLEDNINRQSNNYGLAIPAFYVETAYKKLKVKWGHFISPVGYFTVDTTQNFFNTIPYTYQYGEPFTHTGALATYTVNDNLVIGSGVIRGWDNFDGSGYGSRQLGWMGTATYTWKDKSSLAWVALWSQEQNGFSQNPANPNADPQHSGRYFQTLVYTRPITDKINYVAQSDFGTQSDANTASSRLAGTNGGTARWYGLNQYLFYTYNEKWTWGANFEWFRDEEGYRVGGFLPNLPNTSASTNTSGLNPNRSGYIGNFYQVTLGPKWQINKNMFLRPNFRVDWFGGQATNTNADGSPAQPYNDGNKRSQEIIATDFCITY